MSHFQEDLSYPLLGAAIVSGDMLIRRQTLDSYEQERKHRIFVRIAVLRDFERIGVFELARSLGYSEPLG